MRVSIVVAAADNGTIGRDNRLLWRLPDDLKHFKALTIGKPIVMGRKTYDSIGKPLPDRTNIVITRNDGLRLPGCVIAHSLDAALAIADKSGAPEAMVVGGAQIYRQALPLTSRVHLTQVHTSIEGDAFFPTLSTSEWRELSREPHSSDGRHPYSFTFVTLERAS